MDEATIKSFSAEVCLIESLPQHKNLLRCLSHQIKEDRMRVFVTKYEENLFEFLDKRSQTKNHCPLEMVVRLSLDIVRALEILKEVKIIHRDISSENLCVNYDKGEKKCLFCGF